MWLFQSHEGGCGLPNQTVYLFLTKGLIVKPNMLREQKGRDHWGGSDVAVPLENISSQVFHGKSYKVSLKKTSLIFPQNLFV